MVPKDVQERYQKLKSTINRYRFEYHVHDREVVPQSARDTLLRELAGLEKEYPALVAPDSPTQRVAGTPWPQFKKVWHSVPQWSFNDSFEPQDIAEFDQRVKKFLGGAAPTYVCELKIDGLKIILTYEKGHLVTAATRGDGEVGEDVTHNVRTIESVPLTLERPVDVVVEGEVWMSTEALRKTNVERKKNGAPLYANPRKAAAGALR